VIAEKLISSILSPLMTSDSGADALTMMHVFHVKHLPIVNDKQLLGTISEKDILSQDTSEPIGSYGLTLDHARSKSNDHLFEIMSKLAENKLTVIPVIDDEENYLGLITQDDLIQYYGNSFSFREPGSIIVITTSRKQYSLAEISRIIEAENGIILSSFITKEGDSDELLITLKLNSNDIQRVIAALERYEYDIKASFSKEIHHDSLQERYDLLMTYLDV
jgi:signal-transduction protein with cAMP-binding, CBS, and nucleotidyltransferase domain